MVKCLVIERLNEIIKINIRHKAHFVIKFRERVGVGPLFRVQKNGYRKLKLCALDPLNDSKFVNIEWAVVCKCAYVCACTWLKHQSALIHSSPFILSYFSTKFVLHAEFDLFWSRGCDGSAEDGSAGWGVFWKYIYHEMRTVIGIFNHSNKYLVEIDRTFVFYNVWIGTAIAIVIVAFKMDFMFQKQPKFANCVSR